MKKPILALVALLATGPAFASGPRTYPGGTGSGGVSSSDVANRVTTGPFLKPDAWMNGGTAITTATGTLWCLSTTVTQPITCSGVTYGLGGTVGGNVMFSVYGGALSGGRYAGVTTWGTADGATLIAATASAAQAGTASRGQTVGFAGGAVTFSNGQVWLCGEFDGVAGTYNRIQQASPGVGMMKTMTHTYGTAAASLSATSEQVNGFPVMALVCSQTQVAFP